MVREEITKELVNFDKRADGIGIKENGKEMNYASRKLARNYQQNTTENCMKSAKKIKRIKTTAKK